MRTNPNDLDLTLKSADYSAALDTFIFLAEKQGIPLQRIGSFGKVQYPGISDLDVLVIGSDSQLFSLSRDFEEKRRVDPRFRYVFFHAPVYVPQQYVDESCLMHTFNGLTPMSPGCPLFNKLATQRFTESQERELSWLTFVLSIGARSLYARRNQDASLRFLLLLMRNIAHSLETLISREAGEKLKSRVSSFREQALNNQLAQKLALDETRILFRELLIATQATFKTSATEQHTLLLKRNWLLRTGDCGIKSSRPFNQLTLPTSLVLFAKSFLFPKLRTQSESSHFDTYETIDRKMRSLNLPNSFPSPFRLQRMPVFDNLIRRPTEYTLNQLLSN